MGEQIHYRVLLADADDPRRTGEPVTGTFRTTPAKRRRDVRFVWSGDLAGQGWGINESIGGYRIFDAMAKVDPDFFLCSGDNIYADGPIAATTSLPDGGVYRSLTTEEKSHVAVTLADYRGNFRYNLLDSALRRFNAQVPNIIQWDDHEVRNNWYPGEVIRTGTPYPAGTALDDLAVRSRRAFSEYFPISTISGRPDGRIYRTVHHGPLLDVFVLDMRTYRNANSADDQTTDPQGILGREQLEWLKRELAASRAVWKVIANDMPLGLVVPDPGEGKPNFEAVAQGDPGAPLGRELQIAELLRFVKHRRITGTVWLTADVHHTSAQHYHPSRAAFKDFEPFWEFVSGPLNAGAFPASALDGTFGPDRVFVKAPTASNVSCGRGLPVLRRGRHRRRQRGVDGASAGTGRQRAVHPGAPAGTCGSVAPRPLPTPVPSTCRVAHRSHPPVRARVAARADACFGGRPSGPGGVVIPSLSRGRLTDVTRPKW